MTKSEYMAALQNKLERFNRELQQELMEDYEQHFAEGIAAGKTEEEIMAELGSIEDMIQELPEEDAQRDGILIKTQNGTKIHMTGGIEIERAKIGDASGSDTGAEDSGYIQTPFGQVPATLDKALEEGSDAGRDAEDAGVSMTYTGGYEAVVIDGLIADVSLERSDDGQIRVEYRNNGDRFMQEKYRFYQYEEAGVLHVGVKKNENANAEAKQAVKFMLFGKKVKMDFDNSFTNAVSNVWNDVWNSGTNGSITLDVRIPSGIPQVELKTQSGDINVRDVDPVQLDMSTTSGDMEIYHVTVDRLKINAASGDITAQQVSSSDMEANTASGDMDLTDVEAGALRLQTASGDIEGKYMRGNEALLGAASGDVEFDGAFERYQAKTGSGDVDMKVQAGAREVQISTGSGDVDVDLTAVEGAEVTVSTGSGEAVIHGAGNVRSKISRGTYTVGSGDCKVYVSTGSGDAEVKCR